MVLDSSIFNTQHYKVQIQGKWSNSRKRVVPSPTPLYSIYWKKNLRITFDYDRLTYTVEIVCKLPLDITKIKYDEHKLVKLRSQFSLCPVGWGCTIHRIILYRRVRTPTNKCSRHDIKQSADEVPLILDFWGMRSNPSLPSLAGPLKLGAVVPDRVLFMG